MRKGLYAVAVFATLAASLLGLRLVYETSPGRLGQGLFGYRRDVGQNLEATGIRLYTRPDDEFRIRYPEIFATDAVIVVFGADWCQWCKAQAAALTTPSKTYNILYWKIEDPNGKSNKYSDLMDKWELGGAVPVTVLVERGKVVKTWTAFTPWEDLKPFVEKARKNEHEQKEGFIIGPINGGDSIDIDLDGQRHSKRR